VTDRETRVLRAFADALVPETPGLARARGADHRDGAAAAGVGEYLRETFGPFAVTIARALDAAAVELVVRRRTRDRVRLRALHRSPFVALSPGDRLRAVRLLEDEGVVPWLDERFGDRLEAPGALRGLGHVLNVVTQFAYYSGLVEGDDPLAWRQTGYPGPVDGNAAHRGYEVEAFEEDDY
jgi:hypothetical protein